MYLNNFIKVLVIFLSIFPLSKVLSINSNLSKQTFNVGEFTPVEMMEFIEKEPEELTPEEKRELELDKYEQSLDSVLDKE